jgi:murein DD-endopeptidase MepM/ murein hydrolase activator NlpD
MAVLETITGGRPFTADFGFGEPNLDEFGNPINYYHYGVGHGTTAAHHHTGIDVMVPLGTVLYTPLPGVVRCVGNAGSGDWGQGCGSFPDEFTGGVGNVTILTDSGLKLTFGHVNQSLVGVGQRVAAEQAVATSGGMVGPHLHLDVAIRAPHLVNHAIAIYGGEYFLLDPVPAIQAVLDGGNPGTGAPVGCSPVAAPPFDGTTKVINNVTFHPDRRTVTSAVQGLNCRQFANRTACFTRGPLAFGEKVKVLYWLEGESVTGENRWWVAEDGARIWSGGTVERPEVG